ncbi:MAG: hypothetical protein ABSE93_27705 [Terriglobia bacterium]|jgi:hypothetical protein
MTVSYFVRYEGQAASWEAFFSHYSILEMHAAHGYFRKQVSG